MSSASAFRPRSASGPVTSTWPASWAAWGRPRWSRSSPRPTRRRHEQVAAQLAAVSELGDWADIVPVSAVAGFQLDVLSDVLVSYLPPGRPLYPDGELTDEPEQQLVAELIREAILEGVRDELPHSIAVVVEEMAPREGRDDLIDVHAVMYVERPSQKAIVLGAKGARLKEVGTRRVIRSRPCWAARLPGPADQDRQGLAARPPAATPPGLLRLSPARSDGAAQSPDHASHNGRPPAPRRGTGSG